MGDGIVRHGLDESALAAGNGIAVAEALLRSLPQFVGVRKYAAIDHSLRVLAVLAVGPRQLDNGAPIQVSSLMEQAEPFRVLLPYFDDFRPLANMIAVVSSASDEELRELLANPSPEIAASHLVDEVSQAYLKAGNDGAFLERRGKARPRSEAVGIRRPYRGGSSPRPRILGSALDGATS